MMESQKQHPVASAVNTKSFLKRWVKFSISLISDESVDSNNDFLCLFCAVQSTINAILVWIINNWTTLTVNHYPLYIFIQQIINKENGFCFSTVSHTHRTVIISPDTKCHTPKAKQSKTEQRKIENCLYICQ